MRRFSISNNLLLFLYVFFLELLWILPQLHILYYFVDSFVSWACVLSFAVIVLSCGYLCYTGDFSVVFNDLMNIFGTTIGKFQRISLSIFQFDLGMCLSVSLMNVKLVKRVGALVLKISYKYETTSHHAMLISISALSVSINTL